MNHLSQFMYTLIFFFSFSALATERTEEKCVDRPIDVVYNHVLNYDIYKNHDNGMMAIDIPAVGRLALVDMFRSQSRMSHNDATGSDGYVWIALRPMTVEDSALFPRFSLHCTSAWEENHLSFTHQCRLNSRNNHTAENDHAGAYDTRRNFGLSGFSSDLTVTTGAANAGSACNANQTRLRYTFSITANSSHLEAIIGPMTSYLPDAAAAIIRNRFGDQFFNDYYEEFYVRWANAIPRQ